MILPLAILLQVAASDPAVVLRVRPNPTNISFHALVVPETVTVGQQALYQVAVFVPDDVRQRLRRNPEFVPPELRAMLAYDLASGYRLLRQRTIGATTYEIHVFQRAIFPITAGTHVISPAELTYALPLGSSFFSREESHSLKSEPVTLVARDPPLAGRPNEWGGAVGRFRLGVRLDTRTPRIRDIVTVTARVEGEGNINLLPRPSLAIAWGSVAPGSERVIVDSAGLAVRGAKEFDWLVTPRDSGPAVVPAIGYVSYDIESRQYVRTEAAPETLSVLPGALGGAAAALVGRTLPSLRERWRGERAPWLLSRPTFLLALALVPVPALVVLASKARRRRRRAPTAVDRLRTPTLTHDDARRAFRDAVEERVGRGPLVFDRADDAARVLRRVGVTAATAAQVARTLAELDRAAFAGDRAARVPTESLVSLYEAVDREALRTRGTRSAGMALGLLMVGIVGGATIGFALDAGAAERAFDEGVRAWQSRSVDSAVTAFARATREAPRSVEAWANLGEASWAARDTAGASVAWQRAIRLSPTSRELHDRVGLLGVATDGWISGVLPIDPDVAAGVLGATWTLVWLLVFGALRRGTPRRRPTLIVLLGVAMFAAGIAFEGWRRQRAVDLVVVRGGESLRVLAALGAESSAPVAGGEVARLLERGEVWSRVALDGARTGWIATERLLPLSAGE